MEKISYQYRTTLPTSAESLHIIMHCFPIKRIAKPKPSNTQHALLCRGWLMEMVGIVMWAVGV
eukprot:scaffold7441_cov109-Skeletonema_dohrnii-CCMP3373.AAC.3